MDCATASSELTPPDVLTAAPPDAPDGPPLFAAGAVFPATEVFPPAGADEAPLLLLPAAGREVLFPLVVVPEFCFGAFLTLSLVSFAIVMAPTVPSLARPFCVWKVFTAFSVTSP